MTMMVATTELKLQADRHFSRKRMMAFGLPALILAYLAYGRFARIEHSFAFPLPKDFAT